MQLIQSSLGSTITNAATLESIYDYGLTANNGIVLSQTITVPTVGSNTGFAAVQTYTYDELNRLTSATENVTPHGGSQSQSWKQTYTFDRYGNRRFDFTSSNTTSPASNCTEAICNPTVSTSNNRLTSTGYLYDDAGNTTRDAEYRTFTYDGENKQTLVKNSFNATIGEYFYDGDGKRVKKVVPSTGETTVFVYDAAGKLIGEYSTVVASANDAKVAYLTNDHLGSPRVTTDAIGQTTSRRDFMPFGEEISRSGYGSDDVREKFATYERDAEIDLDFAQARVYDNQLGRFTSSDNFLSSGRSEMPQSWNRYIYVLNCPLRFSDPLGLFEWDDTLKDDPKLDQAERDRRKRYRDKITAAIQNAKNIAKAAFDAGKLTQKKLDKINNALNSYGAENSPNGVRVGLGTKIGDPGSTDSYFEVQNWGPMKVKGLADVKFDEKALDGDAEVVVAHEGAHVDDTMAYATLFNTVLNALPNSGYLNDPRSTTRYQTENNAFHVQSYFFEARGADDKKWGTWKKGWAKLDDMKQELKRQPAIDKTIFDGYGGLSPSNQGSSFSRTFCNPGHCH